MALVAGGFGLILAGLLRLQVQRHEHFRRMAQENRVRPEVLRAPRGAILDRNGALLADNYPSFQIVFRPFPAESTARAGQVVDPEWTVRVGRIVAEDSARVSQLVHGANRSGQSAVLKRNAPFDIVAAVEEARGDLPGVEVVVEPLRRYPWGGLASHLLGYAGEITERELAERAGQDYRAGDLIGRSGVERSCERFLRGRDGVEFVVVNAMGRRVSTLSEGPPRLPQPGQDVVLTVDLAVQQALEEAMSGVRRGAAVAMDPRDGGILGMVSRPAFDPNEFSRGLSFARWRELSSGGANPLLNRAIQGVYPPGSTFKIVTMLAALRAGVSRPSTRYQPCPGGFLYGGRWFGCWRKEGHGSLDFPGALQHSCDVYFYQVGLRLGLPRLEAACKALGLGDRTGIDLPQENRGLVPGPSWYDKRWGAGRWPRGVLLNLAIGQGELLLTPLQMAMMAAAAAGRGRPVRPHVVKEIRAAGPFRPEKPTWPGLSGDAASWDAVRQGLELTVSSGTGTAARVPGVAVAGKTGTAQNPHGEDHALFVCYAPAERPTLALALVIENGGGGGSVAAPIAGAVLRRLFATDSLARLGPVAASAGAWSPSGPRPATESSEVPRGD